MKNLWFELSLFGASFGALIAFSLVALTATGVIIAHSLPPN